MISSFGDAMWYDKIICLIWRECDNKLSHVSYIINIISSVDVSYRSASAGDIDELYKLCIIITIITNNILPSSI